MICAIDDEGKVLVGLITSAFTFFMVCQPLCPCFFKMLHLGRLEGCALTIPTSCGHVFVKLFADGADSVFCVTPNFYVRAVALPYFHEVLVCCREHGLRFVLESFFEQFIHLKEQPK